MSPESGGGGRGRGGDGGWKGARLGLAVRT